MSIPVVPKSYRQGYALAQKHNSEMAQRYIEHTTIGDPQLDPIIEELSGLPRAQFHQYLRACVEQ